MYMRFRMQIESVMKEVTFRAEARALARVKITRGRAGSGQGRRAPGSTGGWGCRLRVGPRGGVEGASEQKVPVRGMTDSALSLEGICESVGPVLSLYRSGN